MSFSTYFQSSSYAMIGCGALALAASGGLGIGLAIVFAVVLVIAWILEETRWQLPERIGLVVVILALPLFYLDWKYQASTGDARENVGVSALAHLVLFLSTVKLFQRKADRDWVFLYLISFFEVLLAAGLSISPVFLATLGLYMLAALSTIISFEIRKARRGVKIKETRLLVAPDSTLIRRLTKRRGAHRHAEARRLPLVSFCLLLLIFALALPLFLLVPRVGSSALARTSGGLTGVSGFSDNVTLGDIGRLQLSNRTVMRVRVEDSPEAGRVRALRWRGVGLDEFNGRAWRRSEKENPILPNNNSERNFYQIGTTQGLHRLTAQTFFLEPMDTPVIFAAPRVVALQGAFPYLRQDKEAALSTRPHDQERISYKVLSDTKEPEESVLRADSRRVSNEYARYLQLPESLDPRIADLAREMIVAAGARNRYDAARAIEKRLQSDYGYALDQKAGGREPLADFLFRVREGHCEYFASAMAVMLRTQGIASRVVTGFQTGEYNDAADAYTVTQKDAHAWVEVYFPQTDSWVTFDPTPAAGRPVRESTGIGARLGKYAEAMELLWFQYVVGYDKQEQRSLATSLRNSLADYRQSLSGTLDGLKASANEWWRALQGESELKGSSSYVRPVVLVLTFIIVGLLLAMLIRRVLRLGLRRGLWPRQAEMRDNSAIEFYERMTKVLAARGLKRATDETPLEFATTTGMAEALTVTRAYNRVRYGEQHLATHEIAEIEGWLSRMEERSDK